MQTKIRLGFSATAVLSPVRVMRPLICASRRPYVRFFNLAISQLGRSERQISNLCERQRPWLGAEATTANMQRGAAQMSMRISNCGPPHECQKGREGRFRTRAQKRAQLQATLIDMIFGFDFFQNQTSRQARLFETSSGGGGLPRRPREPECLG
jgi:hypothetical protein